MQQRKPRHRQMRDAPVRLPIAGNESASAVSMTLFLKRIIRPDVGIEHWGEGEREDESQLADVIGKRRHPRGVGP